MAAITGGALADAQPQSPGGDDRPHLLVVPTTPEGEAALALTDARVVARYKAFSLVEAAGADDQRLREAGADRRDDMRTVRTAAGRLDPKRERPSLAGKQAPGRDEVLTTVQFIGPPKDAWLERVRSTGARIVIYQAENSYVVHANGEEVDRLAALVGSYAPVRTVAVLNAADKLESPRSATGRYAVQTVSGAEGAQARDEAAAAGAGVGRPVGLGQLHTQYLALSSAEAAELARDPAVVAVEPYDDPELADERAAQIVAGNLTGFAPSGSGYLNWLVDPTRIPNDNDFSFAIDVSDEGLDGGIDPPTHSDFRSKGTGASRVVYLNNFSSDTGGAEARDCGGHGTNVASIAAGYNNAPGSLVEDGAGYNHGLGVAPFAQVGVSKVFNCAGVFTSGFSATNLSAQAYSGGARISNNSWGSRGQESWGSYNARAQEYDALVRDSRPESGHQQLVEVFAAGNDGEGNTGSVPNEGYGTILAEGTAKNVITVGAAEGVRASGLDGCGVPDSGADSARDIVDFSSRGPTDDGRLKPDLVAPSTHMVGARPRHDGYTGAGACVPFFGGSSAFYSLISGSSQAAPQVSGAAALVRHWYNRTQLGANPSPALTKALLVNTATDLAGGSTGKGATIAAGPNTDQGWGRVNVGAALDSTERVFHDQVVDDTFFAPGESVRKTYVVQDPNKPVKVTLVWTDSFGPVVGNAWVNNLDLEVEARGNLYLGNVFAGASSRTGGSPDARNNVESVFLPEPSSGRFAVTVKSLNLAGDGVPGNGDFTDQDFALVVSNAEEQEAPVLVHSATTPDAPGGDNDGVLESGEQIELTEAVRNAGPTTAGGLSATLTDPSAGFNITQPTSSYPDLDDGDTGSNSPAFEAEFENASTCGVDATATLNITTTTPSAETHEIPLVLATGEPGASVTNSAAAPQVPLAIPDDSGVGVSSTVFVSPRGRIKDLNVRLAGTTASPAIQHDFLGDVVIDLIAPDGTTVRLAEHPGGPDNEGKDFVDVTFDDDATLRLGDPFDPIPAQRPPYNGSFRPQNDQLSRFDGKDRRGTWTLRIRDLFEGDSGTLRAWGVTSQRALCDFDTEAPATRLLTQPAASSDDTSPSFGFDSPDDPGAVFECRLDAGEYEPCASIKTYGGLALGPHTFYVRAVDGSGNEDASPEVFTWTVVDSVAPVVTLTEPANGSSTTDTTPRLAGVAGTLPGDDATVTLRLWTGTLAVGLPVQTLIVARDGAGGGFAAVPSALTAGTYTARAEQGDSALPSENVGVSAPVTFTVQTKPPAPPAAPSFALAQAEERLSNALANRYTVLAACAAACRVSAKLSVSASSARRLGMRARATAIGEGTKRLVRAGAAAVQVGLTETARKALRGQVSSTATLNVIVRSSAGTTLVLKRKVTLRRSAGLERVARRGMSLWAVCSEDCSLQGALRISAARARELGVKPMPAAGSRVAIAAGSADSGASPAKLTLAVPARLRKILRGASRLTARLEASAGASGTLLRKASRRLTLR